MSSTGRRPNDADADSGRDGGLDSGLDGRRCPECGASRAQGGAPVCGCTERAADAARDTRSAEAAAAEDFDPLRIRPYVTLPEPGLAEETTPEPGPAPAPVLPPEATAPPRSADVGLFRLFAPGGPGVPDGASSAAEGDTSPPPPPYDEDPEPRRGRTGLYAAVGAVAAVVAVAVLAAVLLSPDKPRREEALPDLATRAASAASDSATQAPPPSTASATPSTPPSPSASSSASASSEASPSPTPSRSASPKPRTTPPPSRSTARATGSAEPAEPKADRVLSRGDRGPEVRELQQRLRQLYLYMGDTHGTYDTQVADAVARYQYARGTQRDGRGVYGKETRAALERETREP